MMGDVLLPGSRWELAGSTFCDPVEVIAAHGLNEVVPALERAEAAARAGSWVAGYVSYDASPALDPRLEVPGRPSLPLVWFGVYERPEPAAAVESAGFTLGDWEPGFTEDEHA